MTLRSRFSARLFTISLFLLSASVAAHADEGIQDATRETVLAAHEAICSLKSETTGEY